ncbi:hypothetical protein EIN_118020 [Entamoeba invadens IP1]|uniref:Uncharacterized protein n=1 Tax=Entamoeba invadens IP1 TaxID=370355 RepID=L7FMR6_ENTIV|nr:hypothetical protein EIN_118020 [Entamoeba invadens IP1]ELP92228.1 hypothetical protein EIN_118020 [Entamoeba invadens IP1]|eukprot:XP_004258999.1 hypothetical protein EIN_118020 [Entamoeba invadens IP1]
METMEDIFCDEQHSLVIKKSGPNVVKLKPSRRISNGLPFIIHVNAINNTRTNILLYPKENICVFPYNSVIYTLSFIVNKVCYNNIKIGQDFVLLDQQCIVHIHNCINTIVFCADLVITNTTDLKLFYFPEKFVFLKGGRPIHPVVITDNTKELFIGVSTLSVTQIDNDMELYNDTKVYKLTSRKRVYYEEKSNDIMSYLIEITHKYVIKNSSENTEIVAIHFSGETLFLNSRESKPLVFDQNRTSQIKFGVSGGNNDFEICWSSLFDVEKVFQNAAMIEINKTDKTISTQLEDGILVLKVTHKTMMEVVNTTSLVFSFEQSGQPQKFLILPNQKLPLNLPDPFGKKALKLEYNNEECEIPLTKNGNYKIEGSPVVYLSVTTLPLVIVFAETKTKNPNTKLFSLKTLDVLFKPSVHVSDISITKEELPKFCAKHNQLTKSYSKRHSQKLFIYKCSAEKVNVEVDTIDTLTTFNKVQASCIVQDWTVLSIEIVPPPLALQITQKLKNVIYNKNDTFDVKSVIAIPPLVMTPFTLSVCLKDFFDLRGIQFSFSSFSSDKCSLPHFLVTVFQFYESQAYDQIPRVARSALVANFPVDALLKLLYSLSAH